MKRGAIELSVGTIVIIVHAMSMLILGLVLVKNIFSIATDSVDKIDDKVQGEITKLFTQETSNVVVKLGAGKTIDVKPGDDKVGIAIGARTVDGSKINKIDRLNYKLTLEPGGKNCNTPNRLGAKTGDLFFTPLNAPNSFDTIDGSNAFALIILTIPEGTASCLQKVKVEVRDTDPSAIASGSNLVGTDVFYINIKKASLI